MSISRRKGSKILYPITINALKSILSDNTRGLRCAAGGGEVATLVAASVAKNSF
jgi:hypothetical protein